MVIGIFRDITLIALPTNDRLNDWFIRTDLDAEYENATLLATIDYQVSEKSTITLNLIETVESMVLVSLYQRMNSINVGCPPGRIV